MKKPTHLSDTKPSTTKIAEDKHLGISTKNQHTFSCCQLKADSIQLALKNRQIKHLAFMGCTIKQNFLKTSLNLDFKNITTLRFSCTPIGLLGIRWFGKFQLPNLNTVDFTGSNFQDSCMKYLKKYRLPKLESIIFSGNTIKQQWQTINEHGWGKLKILKIFQKNPIILITFVLIQSFPKIQNSTSKNLDTIQNIFDTLVKPQHKY